MAHARCFGKKKEIIEGSAKSQYPPKVSGFENKFVRLTAKAVGIGRNEEVGRGPGWPAKRHRVA